MLKNETLTYSTFARRANLIFSNIDDEAVILSVDSGQYYNLNSVAADIWNLLEEPHSFNEILDYLVSNYCVDNSTCKTDTIQYLKELISEGIITQTCEEQF